MILVFTSKQDVHADSVIKNLYKRDIGVFRLNSEDILSSYKCNLDIDSKGLWSGTIADGYGRVLRLDKLKVAWFRKPQFNFYETQESQIGNIEFAVSETKAFINSLYSLPNVKWINDPFCANKAKVKFQQLLIAKRFGIRVPRTLITTDPETAKEFFLACGKKVLVKAIYTANVTIDGINQGIPSRLIGPDIFFGFYKNISVSPTQLQEYVPKAYELRITVFGEDVYAVKIDSQLHHETRIDWRLNTKLNPHSIYRLPDHVNKFCTALVREQSLTYGALDFIVSPEGEYFFLENNPFGQYLWLEHETGLALTDAMCNLLVANM